jgi:hypothetical protein
MAFGQASGPPAPQRRVAELAELLAAKGYDSFREARHPFDLTQRQAAGKFTTAEVDELIERLGAEGSDNESPPEGPAPTPSGPPRSDDRRRRQMEELVVKLDADIMATELENRGWCVIAPPD